jgi:hypothetical protein
VASSAASSAFLLFEHNMPRVLRGRKQSLGSGEAPHGQHAVWQKGRKRLT